MYDFFNFPSEYKVKKPMTVERFLKSVNTTESEYKKLSASIHDVEILYDILDEDDNELIIIAAEISNFIDEYQQYDIARAIATSIPQLVLVVLFVGKYARIFAFETSQNTQNLRRRVIKREISTVLFNASQPEEYAEKTVHFIQGTDFPVYSAKSLYEDWVEFLIAEKEERKHKRFFKKEAISNLVTQILEDAECDYYDDEILKDESEDYYLRKGYGYSEDIFSQILPEYERFQRIEMLKCLREYANILYSEFEETYYDLPDSFSLEEWAYAYIWVCNDIFKAFFRTPINKNQICTILNAITGEDDDFESNGSYQPIEIDEVRKMLEEYLHFGG